MVRVHASSFKPGSEEASSSTAPHEADATTPVQARATEDNVRHATQFGVNIGQISFASSENATPHGNGDSAPIQRVVQSKVRPLKGGGTTTVYYSTYNTTKEFTDKKKAWEYDKKMRRTGGPVRFDPYARRPTNYSYYNTPSHNVVEGAKQGPHSLSHSATAYRLGKRMRDTDADVLFAQQVLPPDEFKMVLDTEKPSTFKAAQETRMLTDYDLMFDRFGDLSGSERKGEQGQELMMRLMQMDPYTAYGKGKTVSKGRIKNKGERRDDSFEEAFDKKAKFTSTEGFEEFRKRRKQLFLDKEESSDDSSDESSDGT